jgi:hypothetical protein
LRAFFEGGRLTAQVRQDFAGEMKRARNQDGIWFRTGNVERFTN